MKWGLGVFVVMAVWLSGCGSSALGLVELPAQTGHAPAPAAPGTKTNDLCLACHGQPGVTRKLDNNKEQRVDTVEPQAFASSAHRGAACVSCHAAQAALPHQKLTPPDTGVPGDLVDAVAVCSTCHQEAYEGYFHTSHGIVRNLKDGRAPDCVDCHGAHDVREVRDWTHDERGQMCARCHSGADAAFAQSALGHREASRDWFPTSYFAGRFLIILTAGVLAFGILHTELDVLRWGIARARNYRRGAKGQ